MRRLTDSVIVLSEGATYNERRCVLDMIAETAEACGVAMTLVTDAQPPVDGEIILGKTSRDAGEELCRGLDKDEYAIVSREGAVYVAYNSYLSAISAIKRLGELCREGATLPVSERGRADLSGMLVERESPELIRVMSTNIVAAGDLSSLQYLGEKYGVTYVDRIDLQGSMILDYLPDFIGMQEIQEGTVNKVEGYMHTEMIKRIGERYTEVDLDEFVPLKKNQWTPIYYRHDKWELLECRAATDGEIMNAMHRWQWGVYRCRENGMIFIHLNLHGPHSGNQTFIDFQPVFFAEVNGQIKALLEKYPSAALAVTGDFNQKIDSAPLGELLKDTTLDCAAMIASDTTYPETYGGIDHIFITTDTLSARAYRMIDNGLIYMTSDHRPVFTDLAVKK